MSNETKHTPGPWRVEPCSHGGMILRRGPEQPIKDRHPQSHLQIVPEADARLIAAAPDLLEALKTASRLVRRFYSNEEADKLDAAIQKATQP